MKEIWDAGEIGCGKLAFELYLRLNRLESGDILQIITHDPGAPTDLPAWCQMTGHTLIAVDPPTYTIRRK